MFEYWIESFSAPPDGGWEGTLCCGKRKFAFRTDHAPFSFSPCVLYTSTDALVDGGDPGWHEAPAPTLRPQWRAKLNALLDDTTRAATAFVLRGDLPANLASNKWVDAVLATRQMGLLPNDCGLFDNLHVLQSPRLAQAHALYKRFGRKAIKFAMTSTPEKLDAAVSEPDDDVVTFGATPETVVFSRDNEFADAWARVLVAFRRRPLTRSEFSCEVGARAAAFFLGRGLVVPLRPDDPLLLKPQHWKRGAAFELLSEARHHDAPESLGCARHGPEERCRSCFLATQKPPIKFVCNAFYDPGDELAAAARLLLPPLPPGPELGPFTVKLGIDHAAGLIVMATHANAGSHGAPQTPNQWALLDDRLVFVDTWNPLIIRRAHMFHSQRFSPTTPPLVVVPLPCMPSEALAGYLASASVQCVQLVWIKSQAEWTPRAWAAVQRVLKDGSVINFGKLK